MPFPLGFQTRHSRFSASSKGPPVSYVTVRCILAATIWICGAVWTTPAQAQRLSNDPRVAPPPTPVSIFEVAAGFAPAYVAVGAPVDVSLPDEGEVAARFDVIAGGCYAAVGFTNAVADLDVWVRDAGTLIAQDVRPNAFPVARWCSSRTTTLDIALSAYTSGGAAQLALYADAETIERSRGSDTLLANRLAASIGRSAPGWSPIGPPTEIEVPQSGTRGFPLDVGESQCLGILAVGAVGVEDLDLVVRDADDAVIVSDLALDATPLVVFCVEAAQTLRIELTVSRGAGVVATQILRPPSTDHDALPAD